MTQPHFTLSSEPVAVLVNVTNLFTVGTTRVVFYNLRITGDSHWKVAQGKWTDGNWPTPSSLTVAVLPNQVHCKLELVVLDVLDGSV